MRRLAGLLFGAAMTAGCGFEIAKGLNDGGSSDGANDAPAGPTVTFSVGAQTVMEASR